MNVSQIAIWLGIQAVAETEQFAVSLLPCCPTCPNRTMWRAVFLRMDYRGMKECSGAIMTMTEHTNLIWSSTIFCEKLQQDASRIERNANKCSLIIANELYHLLSVMLWFHIFDWGKHFNPEAVSCYEPSDEWCQGSRGVRRPKVTGHRLLLTPRVLNVQRPCELMCDGSQTWACHKSACACCGFILYTSVITV